MPVLAERSWIWVVWVPIVCCSEETWFSYWVFWVSSCCVKFVTWDLALSNSVVADVSFPVTASLSFCSP